MQHDHAMLHEVDNGGDQNRSTEAELNNEINAQIPILANHAKQRSSTSNTVSSRLTTPPPCTLQRDNSDDQGRNHQPMQSQQHTATASPPSQSLSTLSNEEDHTNTLLQSQYQPASTEVTPPLNNHDPPHDEENPLPPLEATLVVDDTLPNNVSNVPNNEPRVVYMASQVESNNKTYFCGILFGVLISLLFGGMATAIVMLVVQNNSNNVVGLDTQQAKQTTLTTKTSFPYDTQEIEPTFPTTPPTSILNSTVKSPVSIYFHGVQISFTVSRHVATLTLS